MVVLLYGLVAFLSLSSRALEEEPGEIKPSSQASKILLPNPDCGPASLWILLKCRGKSIEFDAVGREVLAAGGPPLFSGNLTPNSR